MYLIECFVFNFPPEENSYVRDSPNWNSLLSLKYNLYLIITIQDKLLELGIDEHWGKFLRHSISLFILDKSLKWIFRAFWVFIPWTYLCETISSTLHDIKIKQKQLSYMLFPWVALLPVQLGLDKLTSKKLSLSHYRLKYLYSQCLYKTFI